MNQQALNFEQPEAEIGSITDGLVIPFWLQILVSTISLILVTICAFCFYRYIQSPKEFASPRDLGLSGIFIISVSALFLVWTPWAKLGIRITKIGGIEFKEIIQGQASEHAEDLRYLEERIDHLETITEKNELNTLIEMVKEPDLKRLLLKFLTKYRGEAFTPDRIRIWGAKQPEFSDLSTYDHLLVRRTLQKLVAEGKLVTSLSAKGKTLYRIPLS
ncbi:hypothetical protein [Vibrio aerogenes]|uniref:hypothetical protein n=1 Tax=Vibrio aerogenes TaxID=92172 RepID=UPI0021C4C8C0|nr:hypothetical protein [Vibrio aerogenes]